MTAPRAPGARRDEAPESGGRAGIQGGEPRKPRVEAFILRVTPYGTRPGQGPWGARTRLVRPKPAASPRPVAAAGRAGLEGPTKTRGGPNPTYSHPLLAPLYLAAAGAAGAR